MRKTLDLRIPKGKQQQISSAFDLIEKTADGVWMPILAEWGTLPPDAREQALAKSPLFARLVVLAERVSRA